MVDFTKARALRGLAGADLIEPWKWRPLEDVRADIGGMTEIPSHITDTYGQFMKEQAKRAKEGKLGPRDMLKAYGITRSSVNRAGREMGDDLASGPTRPEGYMAEWLMSPEGQRYLNAAEKGTVDPKAIEDIVQRFQPFGMAETLGKDLTWGAQNLPQRSTNLSTAVTGPADQWRQTAQGMHGIGPAKSGFIASLVGRGDMPTLDARQIKLQSGSTPAEAKQWMGKGSGRGGDAAVDRLSQRQLDLNLGIPDDLRDQYQHLTHHALWDAVGGTKTTHEDLVRAMQRGGATPAAMTATAAGAGTAAAAPGLQAGTPADFLQSLSNTAASTVSAPVDIATWLANKAGEGYDALRSPRMSELVTGKQPSFKIDKPFLGSDWMEEKGLTKKVPQTAASLGGETVGNILPFAAAKKAPEIAAAMLRGGENLAAPKTLGSQRGVYLAHTPSKPDPTVGTRFEREDLGGLAPKTPLNIEGAKGGSFMTGPWDSSGRNQRITSVSEEKLPQPVVTTGGQDFARDLKNIEAGRMGASNKSMALRGQSRVDVAHRENLDAGGTGRVFVLPSTMGPNSEFFSTMPTEVLMQLMRNADLSKTRVAGLDKLVRDMPVVTKAGTRQPFKGFAGFNDPDFERQILEGAGAQGGTAGELRKAISDRLTLKENQKLLGYNMEDMMAAIQDPALRGVPKGYVGNTVMEGKPGASIMDVSNHPAYNRGQAGNYLGTLGASGPMQAAMPKTYNRLFKEMQGRGGDPHQNAINAMDKRGAGFSEVIDQQTIDSWNQWLEAQAKLAGR